MRCLVRLRPLLAVVRRLLLPSLSVREITDGNVNFSHVVSGAFGAKVFIKQAEGFLKWQPAMALERERMAREVRYFRDASSALGAAHSKRYLPEILAFDHFSSVLLMARQMRLGHAPLRPASGFERRASHAAAARRPPAFAGVPRGLHRALRGPL